MDAHFARQDKAKGSTAFAAWEQRLLGFLNLAAPSLLPIYKQTVKMHPAANLFGLTVHQNWKRNKGDTLEAFLVQAIQDARAGRLTASANAQLGSTSASPVSFIDKKRISHLKSISNAKFDTTRLVRMCEEANTCFQQECYLAVLMLCRSILDHVPPIFGHMTFAQVASNYSPKSVKSSLLHLEESLRNIADSALHTHIRQKDVLPTKVQVNFSAELDVLLGEVARVLAGNS